MFVRRCTPRDLPLLQTLIAQGSGRWNVPYFLIRKWVLPSLHPVTAVLVSADDRRQTLNRPWHRTDIKQAPTQNTHQTGPDTGQILNRPWQTTDKSWFVTVFSSIRFLSSAYNQRNILIEIGSNHVLNHKITATVLKPAWHRFGDFSI